MLYIFHVDTGTMMTFDINFALESVEYLKGTIEKMWHIPATAQVLLVSGGEVLRSDAKVCSYSAGTDTNPIYMFSKKIIESNDPPKSSYEYGPDVDLTSEVEACLAMSPSFKTVVACSKLAKHFGDLARDYNHICDKLVHDQHLQQQGWAAVVANVEDVTLDFQERAEDFEQKVNEHLNNKDEYVEFLSRFNEDLELLSSIPILPALRLNAVSNPFTAFDELHADSESFEEQQTAADDEDTVNKVLALSDETPKTNIIITADTQGSNEGSSRTSSLRGAGDSTASEGDEGIGTSRDGRKTDGQQTLQTPIANTRARQSNKEAITLLHWITAKENQESLRQIADYCEKALELFDSSVMASLRREASEVMGIASQEVMKRIKGLEERLSGLDKIMYDTRRLEQEQLDLAQAFHQNQQSAGSLGDPSVLRTLCESHRRQLRSMLRNHQRMREIRNTCVKAKDEFSLNIYTRLKWIVYVENRMFETDSRLMFYHRSLARLKQHLAVVSQLHRAPRLFCTAVQEIVRRRTFSQAFLAWASDLACHLLTIHNDEVMRRKDFDSLFSGHFLGGLFPGTEDLPPAYGTQAPRVFDMDLPKLTQADVDVLSEKLPDLTPEIVACDMSSVTQFFLLRSGSQEKSGERQVTDERILAVVREAGLDRFSGFESETDTEEFEKVGQSPMERGKADTRNVPVCPQRADAATLTEVRQPPPKPPRNRPPPLNENLESHRSEVDGLKENLASLSHICSESINVLKSQLAKLKTDTLENQATLKDHCNEISVAWDRCNLENAVRERETLQRLTVDHELEMNDIKQSFANKDEQIRTLQLERAALEVQYRQIFEEKMSDLNNCTEQIENLQNSIKHQCKSLEESELSKQKALKDLQEKMSQEYKGELESLRSRFRLVALTSMDRSPSESSLEKIERPDMIEISNHKTILSQTKEDMEVEKEEAIKAALEKQEAEWKIKLEQEIQKVRSKLEAEKQITLTDSVKRIMEEKDRQLDQSRDRESLLMRECMKYKETIQQLSDPETSDYPSSTFLQSQVAALEIEKRQLEEQLKLKIEASQPSTRILQEQQTERVQVKDSSTSPDPKIRGKPSKGHTPVGLAQGTLRISSCNIGDTVLILWDAAHSNYTVFQESASLFLLHSDSLPALDLKLTLADESERRLYSIGEVESKEYCAAVKTGNKYQVAYKARFYRVRVKPFKYHESILKNPAYCCDSSKDKASNQSKSATGMSSSTTDITSSYNSSKNQNVSMAKSVCAVPPDATASSFPMPVFQKLSRKFIIKRESLEEKPQEVDDAKLEQMDSIECNPDLPPIVNEAVLNPCFFITSAEKPSEASNISSKKIASNDSNTDSEAAVVNQPMESVPYDNSNEECVTYAGSPENLSAFVSEIAEEAAP